MALAQAVDPGWDVLADPGVTFGRRNYRVPDIAVVRNAALDGATLGPSDVLLAVEVMSPSSVSNDRVTKPAQYAAAGIPFYWRIEMDPPQLVQHALEDGVYRELGRGGGSVQVTEPVTMTVDLDALLS